MGIDRIGKGGGIGGPTGPTGPGAPAPSQGTGQAFEVRRAERPLSPAQAAEVKGVATSPLEQLKSGQIDAKTYVERKVEEATAHLHGLRPTELDAIKRMLRDKLATDPALTELVRGVTGQAPVLDE